MLNAIDAAERRLSLAGIRTAFARENHFQTIRQFRDLYGQVRVIGGQQLEGVIAGGDDRSLKLCDGIIFYAGGVRHITRYATNCSGETRIGVNLQPDRFGFSFHGHHGRWRVIRRTPPGNPGNSIARRSRGAPYLALCRWCSTSRTYSRARSCRTDRKRSARAWESLRKECT